MEAGLREEQPTPPPADSPQRHNSALSNAGCSSGAGASDVIGWRDVVVGSLWCADCGQTYECKASGDFMLPVEMMLGVDRFGGVYGWLGRHDCHGAIDYGF